MRDRVDWIEPVLLRSEHEAAFLERHLLERRRPPFNRAIGGLEAWIWLRLAAGPVAPGLTTVHEPEAGPQETLFGPYLGGGDARLAVAALLRLHPLVYAMEQPDASAREMGRLRGVGSGDRDRLADSIRAVLDREPLAVEGARRQLAQLRDDAAQGDRFEDAATRQQQLQALDWLTQPQAIATPTGPDLDVSACSGSVSVTFQVRRGSFHDRRVRVGVSTSVGAASADFQWNALARANAELLDAYLRAGAVGEGLGRLSSR